MLGEEVIDEAGAEGAPVHRAAGLGLLPLTTWFEAEKVRTQVTGSLGELDGPLSALSGKCLNGYEIHMGRTAISGGRGPEDTGRLVDYRAEPEICRPMAYLLETQSDSRQVKTDGWNRGNVYGSYVHGVFDDPGIARSLTEALLAKKGFARTWTVRWISTMGRLRRCSSRPWQKGCGRVWTWIGSTRSWE